MTVKTHSLSLHEAEDRVRIRVAETKPVNGYSAIPEEAANAPSSGSGFTNKVKIEGRITVSF